jgi:deoxyribose-phosphate aldolase
MIIEYAVHDTSINDTELKAIISNINTYSINTISVLPGSIKITKLNAKNTISVACPIDYPLGTSSTETRLSMVNQAVKNGATIIDIMIPHHLICNRKYDKFRDDVKLMLELCNSLGVKLRYMFEYRVFNYETLYKLAQILSTYGIYDIFPSSGYRLDNLHDNILAGAMIHKKTPNINIIYNGNIWNKNQIDQIISIKPYGIRFYSTNALDLLYKNI